LSGSTYSLSWAVLARARIAGLQPPFKACGVRFQLLRDRGTISVMRFAALLVAALLFAVPAALASSSQYWSITKVLRRLDGAKTRVGTHTVRIDSETTLCAGRKSSIRRNGVRMWRRFACTYTTFTKSGVDRDLDFRVSVLSARRYAILDAHWVQAPR
jgi:hypothetical protein